MTGQQALLLLPAYESDRRQLDAAIAEIRNQIEETERLARLPDHNLDVIKTRHHMVQAILNAMIEEVK
tara:strand:+ start:879 stop:1082 length:204 start_codon:yes stop_codon:yes gene_type:complete